MRQYRRLESFCWLAIITSTTVALTVLTTGHALLLAQDGGGQATQFLLPMVQNERPPLARRIGFNVTSGPLTHYPIAAGLAAGWYHDWSVTPSPMTPDGIEYVQVIRVHQRLVCGLRHHSDRVACPY